MRRSILPPLIRFFVHDIGWKLLSLAAAVLLWIFAASEPEMSRFVTVPVEFKDLPEGLEISSDVIESVNLEVRGPAGELRAMEADRSYAVVLDMSRVQAGERTFTVGENTARLPQGVDLVRAVPSQLRFDFERRVSRTVPVEVRFGPAQSGYDVAAFEVSPTRLRIVGPESRVNRVTAVSTDPVDLSQVVGAAEFHVTAFVSDPQVRFAETPNVKVSVKMRARSDAARRHGIQ